MNGPAYSVVVATLDRPDLLAGTLQSLENQTQPPAQVIIVDASENEASAKAVEDYRSRLPCRYLHANSRSAALQRNQGAELVNTPLIAFTDDDVILRPDTMEQLAAVFADDEEQQVGGVAARIEGLEHRPPRGLLWWYYRLQAGYAHPDYGARLFGPAINCLPCYEAAGKLIAADWLNAGCTLYRTALFQAEQFPDFEGYSHMEDVHLSARIGRRRKLYFHRDAVYQHLDAGSAYKKDVRKLARLRINNQRRVAQEILGLRGLNLTMKLFLHRLFVTCALLKSAPPEKWAHIRGLWS
jgi:GT2 family glycosyltransferase